MQSGAQKTWMASSTLLLVGILGPTLNTAAAQSLTSATGPQIVLTPESSQKVSNGAPDRFTGAVRVQSLFDAKDEARATGGKVTFQPGARSAWHTHPLGQILIVTDDVGWFQQWGGAVRVMRKGDVIWDSGWRQALARRDANKFRHPYCNSGRPRRQERRLA
jgi:hypothetical protein